MHASVSAARRIGLLVLCLALLAVAQGCGYVRHRGQDALDMFDFGFTFSRKPQFGLYANCPFLAPAGYGKVDGTFAGIGGGKIGVMDHHQDNVGLLVWGREKTTWDKTAAEHAGTEVNQVAPAGFVTDAVDSDKGYDPACVHYLHLGWVGLTGNIHYAEIPDFFAGWVGFDPSRDDAEPRGRVARVARTREKTERETIAQAAEPAPSTAAAASRAQAPAAAPVVTVRRPKTEFCPVCGGRRFIDRWPPVPDDLSPEGRSASDRRWSGLWCTCWSSPKAGPPAKHATPSPPASPEGEPVPEIASLAQSGGAPQVRETLP